MEEVHFIKDTHLYIKSAYQPLNILGINSQLKITKYFYNYIYEVLVYNGGVLKKPFNKEYNQTFNHNDMKI